MAKLERLDDPFETPSLQQIGHGLCSIVLKAPCRATAVVDAGGVENVLCLKQVDVDVQNAPHHVQHEVSLLSRLRHKNLVLLLAAFTEMPDAFTTVYNLAMPLYPVKLTDVMDDIRMRPSSLSLREVEAPETPSWLNVLGSHTYASLTLSVAEQLCETLLYLHNEGVAHRDIKPSNILFGTDGLIRLIDFGVAWEAGMYEAPPFGTHPSMMGSTDRARISDVGTGAFRAPELLFAPQDGYDAFAADMWSLGTVLASFFTDLVQEEDPLGARAEVASWELEMFPDLPPALPRVRLPTYERLTLFDSSRGDIALAADIFKVLGLPSDASVWPEAARFQPPLAEFPFLHGPAKETLEERLPQLALLAADASPLAMRLHHFITQCLPKLVQLSAVARPRASEVLSALQSCP